MNKLLRTVKTFRKARELNKTANITVFTKKTFGYKQNGEVSKVIVNDIVYEVYEGDFYNYQHPLRINQIAERLTDPA